MHCVQDLNQHGNNFILKRNAIPSGQRLNVDKTLQQDNDPNHSSQLCKKYLKEETAAGICFVMARPAQSPDLNPIEVEECVLKSSGTLPKHNSRSLGNTARGLR